MPLQKRNFVISSCNGKKLPDVGNFVGTSPKAVAQKAAKTLFKGRAQSASGITFCIRETTKDSKKKTYSYRAVKKILDPPIIINRGGVEIKIKTEYKLTPMEVPLIKECPTSDTVTEKTPETKPVRKPRAKKEVKPAPPPMKEEVPKPKVVRKPRAKKVPDS